LLGINIKPKSGGKLVQQRYIKSSSREADW